MTTLSRILQADDPFCAKARSGSLTKIVVPVLTALTTIASVVDELTMAFQGIFGFRVRLFLCLALLFSIAIVSTCIVLLTHECDGLIEGHRTKHYTYRRTDRILSLIILPVSIIAFLIACTDFKYWLPAKVPIQGWVVDPSWRPVEGALVDAVDPDGASVVDPPQVTDFDGLFVLDPKQSARRAAYFFIKAGPCFSKTRIANDFYTLSRKQGSTGDKDRQSLTIRIACAGS